MNHCHDCNSDYATPGTCNCFAVGGKRHTAPLQPNTIPLVPIYPTYPWYPSWPVWIYTPTVTSDSITITSLPVGTSWSYTNGQSPQNCGTTLTA